MPKSAAGKFSANEKEIAALLKENQAWKEAVSFAAEEINFLTLFLNADIFQKNVLNLYEKLRLFSNDLEAFKTEHLEFTKELHNHRYDIEGILECEDISCEVFYHDEHLKLGQRVENFLERFEKLKLKIYTSTGHLLRKSSKEN